jgi:hypothetical protein
MTCMKLQTKNFHFQEINKIVIFPLEGNKGKYNHYLVQIKTPQTINTPVQPSFLGDFLGSVEVDSGYPHTVGYFKESNGEEENFKPQYLSLRKVYTIEEFWVLLNEVCL